MTPFVLLTALSLMMLEAAPATSQPAAAAPASAAAKTDARNDPDKVLCRNEPVTGSRFVRHVCMTRAQWNEQQRRLDEFERRINQNPNAAQSNPLGG